MKSFLENDDDDRSISEGRTRHKEECRAIRFKSCIKDETYTQDYVTIISKTHTPTGR